MTSIPYFSLFVAYVLIYVPRFWTARAQAQMPEGYDNNNPRSQQSRLPLLGQRALAAHQNSFEAFAPFAAGVLLCLLTQTRPNITASLCLTFLLARTIYLVSYLRDIAALRSLVWILGAIATAALLLLPVVS